MEQSDMVNWDQLYMSQTCSMQCVYCIHHFFIISYAKNLQFPDFHFTKKETNKPKRKRFFPSLKSQFNLITSKKTAMVSVSLSNDPSTCEYSQTKIEKMVGPSFIDEIDCGNFFDHIDDLLDFPVEDVVDGCADTFPTVPAAGDCNSLASIWPPQTDSFPGVDSMFSDKSASDLSAELSVPYEDIVQLEWLSNFVEDSFSGVSLTMSKVDQPSCTTMRTTTKESSSSFNNQFETSSPVSVLESSSSYSGGKSIPREIYIPVPCGRARSKRPRPAAFKPNPAMHLISPAESCVGENIQPNVVSIKASSECENFAESQPVRKMAKHCSGEQKKRKKIKLSIPSPSLVDDTNQNGSQAIRKCMHCEITKTPQWRAGPMGPKTLCNACGVRYKSGRLFPEYRPAASPTFCPSVHSNSHKKVLEMRYRSIEETGFGSHSAAAASPELIPNTNSSILTLEYM